MSGFLRLINLTKKLQLKWMVSYFNDNEEENIDITGAYLFGERDFDPTSATSGEIINPLGQGVNQNYARNKLNIDVCECFTHGKFG